MAVTFHSDGRIDGFNVSSMPSGTVVQAKHLQFTTDLAFTAGSITDVTGFNLSITPSSASNDIIIILHATMGMNCDGRMGLKRNGSLIEEYILGTGRNNASGGAPQAAGIYFAGSPGSGSPGATEEFTGETTAVTAETIEFD